MSVKIPKHTELTLLIYRTQIMRIKTKINPHSVSKNNHVNEIIVNSVSEFVCVCVCVCECVCVCVSV
jgi:hypothetical protein